MPAKKSTKGNSSPLVLSLGGGELTIEASDVSYITDFVTSLTGGQVKIRLQKLLNRKTLSYDDAVQCAEALAGEYVEFIKTFSKYESLPNKKSVLTRAKRIASTARELLKEESEEEDVVSGSEETDDPEVDGDSSSDTKSEGGEGEEDEEDEEDSDSEELEKEDGDTDEELEARAGASGFIPISRPARAGNSGKILTKTTLLTATYRTKEGREHNPTAVVGVGPGKLRFETELNEDGSLKRKTSNKNQQSADSTMYFYTGSLSEENSAEVPLKTGIRLTDSSQLQRAFSQEVFTHKSLRKTEKRSAVKGAIIKWLGEEVDEGVSQVLDQIYEEAKMTINSEKQVEREVKRKLDGKQALLKKAAKKSKKSN